MSKIKILFILLFLVSIKFFGTNYNSEIKNDNKTISTVEVVKNISQLQRLSVQQNSQEMFVEVLGYHNPGDGGGGSFYYDPNSTAPTNSGTVFSLVSNRNGIYKGRFIRLYSGAVNVLWFGAKRNTNTREDQAKPFNGAIKYAQKSGDAVFIPNGVYQIRSTINIFEGIELSGENMRNTVLKCDVAGDFAVLENYSNRNSNGGRTSLKSFTINTLSRYGIFYETDTRHYPFSATFERIEVIAVRKGAYYNNTAVRIEGLSHAHFDTVLCKSIGTAFVMSSDKFNTGVMTFSNCQFGDKNTNRIGFHFAEGKALDSFVFNSCFFGGTHTAELIGSGNNSVASVTHNACHYENFEGMSDDEVGSSLIQFNLNSGNEGGYGAVGFSWNNCMLGGNHNIETAVKFNAGYYSSISFNGTRIVNTGNTPDFYFDDNTVFRDCEISGLSSQIKESEDSFYDKSITWENKEGWQWGWNVYNNGYYNLQNGKRTDDRNIRLTDSTDNIPDDVRYNIGDIFYNNNPHKGSYVGWICVEAGEPGKWKRFGKIK